MRRLPSTTVQRLRTGTVIVDVVSVVKELIENALDAGASRIDIKMENGGLKLIQVAFSCFYLLALKDFKRSIHVLIHYVLIEQVKDSGSGIPRSDVALSCAPYFTSKIDDFSSLEHLQTYGFRCASCLLVFKSFCEQQEQKSVDQKQHLHLHSFLVLYQTNANLFLQLACSGEALYSLCGHGRVAITTRTADDDSPTFMTFDHSGQPIE